MNQYSDKRFRIVSWPFMGVTATGIIDKTGYVIIAVNYRMDSNIGEGDTWVADELYTNDIPEQDWSLVREATVEEKLALLDALSMDKVVEFELINKK